MSQFLTLQALNAQNFESGLAEDGQVLTADGVGGASWQQPGGGSVTDVTYAELVAAIGASELVPGAFYRITDFATTHYIGSLDYWGKTFTRHNILVGPNEPLIALASSESTITSQVYSALYPADVIYYDWDPANWLGDRSFIDDLGVIIANFRGVIVSRHDTANDILAPSDWRHCKTRRWATDAAAWNGGTTYNPGNIVEHAPTSRVYKALAASANQEPIGSDNDYWIVMLNISTFPYWNCDPSEWIGVPSDAADYADFTLFNGDGAKSVHIAIDASQPEYYQPTILPMSVFFDPGTTYKNVFGPGFRNNSVGANFSSNSVGANFNSNSVGASFRSNSVGASFSSNSVGAYFYNNSVGANFYNNSVGAYFYSNSVGANFNSNSVGASFRSNSVGVYFNSNSVGANFSSNSVGANFYNNSVGAYFYNNSVGANVSQSINYTSATHVYAPYNCDIYTDATLGARLRYVNNNALVFAAANA